MKLKMTEYLERYSNLLIRELQIYLSKILLVQANWGNSCTLIGVQLCIVMWKRNWVFVVKQKSACFISLYFPIVSTKEKDVYVNINGRHKDAYPIFSKWKIQNTLIVQLYHIIICKIVIQNGFSLLFTHKVLQKTPNFILLSPTTPISASLPGKIPQWL